jgi:hypothetical protein
MTLPLLCMPTPPSRKYLWMLPGIDPCWPPLFHPSAYRKPPVSDQGGFRENLERQTRDQQGRSAKALAAAYSVRGKAQVFHGAVAVEVTAVKDNFITHEFSHAVKIRFTELMPLSSAQASLPSSAL